MAASIVAALVISVISACIGSIYYCRQPVIGRDSRRDEEEYDESPFVRIKISHPHRKRILEDGACTDADERMSSRECADSNNNRGVFGEAQLCGREDSEVVPMRPPRSYNKRRSSSQLAPGGCCCEHNDRKCRRTSKGIWSSAMQNRLENMSNSQQQANSCDGVRIVRAEVEVYPCSSVSTSNETPDQIRQDALPSSKVNSTYGTKEGSSIPGECSKRHHSSVVKKWKHLKKSIMCSRSCRQKEPGVKPGVRDGDTEIVTRNAWLFRLTKSVSIKEVREEKAVQVELEEDELRRLNIPVRASPRRSPVGHSTMLQKNRLVDASTSTRLSANVTGTNHERRGEICAHDTGRQSHAHRLSREVVDPKDDSRQSKTEVLEDVVSLIKRRSVDGKSLCDLRITGLAMNQAELLDLFEATGGKSKSASIITTEEASIISIKFQRDHRVDTPPRNDGNTSFPSDSPFSAVYKLLPEKVADIGLAKWFRSNQKSSSHKPQFISLSKNLCASPNETAYLRMPRAHSVSSEDSPFQRETNISRRFTRTSFARFAQERRI